MTSPKRQRRERTRRWRFGLVNLSSSPSIAKTVAEKILQLGDGIDLLDGRIDVVFNAAITNGFAIEQDVAGAPVAVARLTDRSDLAQCLATIEPMAVIDLFGTAELIQVVGHLLDEDARHMGMTLETVALDQREDAFHLALIVDVFGEDVFVERITGGAVNEQAAVLAEGSRSLGQKLPAPLAQLPGFGGGFELIAGPENGALRRRIESIRIEHSSLIVIAEQDDLAPHHEIHALARVRPIADNISQAVDIGDRLFFNILEDRL